MRTPATSPVMVGRDRDLAALHEAHLATTSGAPRGVVVAGEVGIGKTRLLDEFVEGLGDDVVVARGQCVAIGTLGSPLAPVRAVLRDLVGRFGAGSVVEAAGPAGHLLSALVPELAGEGASGEEVAQEQLHDIVGQLVAQLSRRAPLVLLVEDVHWADVATLGLVRSLLATLRDSRALVVLSYRTDDVGRGHPLRPVLLELERDRAVTRLELRRLDTEAAAELALLIRGERLDPAALDLLLERSEGVPFFVEELVGLQGVGVGSLPETLRDLVLARYAHLGEATQAVVRLLSAGGVTVEHDLVTAVHDGAAEDFEAAVREAVAAQVLTTSGTAYSFRHALTQEAVHDELLPGERVRYHARYAAALEARPDVATRAAEVAHHWLLAHDLPRAFAATLAAQREARAAGAPGSAARLGERALELWPQVPDAAAVAGLERADLFVETAVDYDEAGDARALAVMEEGLAECPREDRRRYAPLLHEAMVVWHAHGRPGTRELGEQALAHLPQGDEDEDRVVRLRVRCGVALVRAFEGDLGSADLLEEVAADARRLQAEATDPDVQERARVELVRALTNLGSVRAWEGDTDTAVAIFDEAVAEAGDDPSAVLRDAERRAMLLWATGRYKEAIEAGLRGQAVARDLGMERGWGLSIGLSAVAALLALCRWDEAEALLDRVRTMRPWGLVGAYEACHRAELHLVRDELVAAEEVLHDAGALLETAADNDAEDAMALALAPARLALARGDLLRAWSTVDRFDRHPQVLPGSSYALLATGAAVVAAARRGGAVLGDLTPDEAEQRLRTVFAGVPTWDVKAVWGALLEAELSGPGRDGTDVAAWEEAVRAAAGGRVPLPEHAYALYRLAEAQLAAGDRAGAADALAGATALAEQHGLVRLGRLVDELASRSGTERPGRAAGPLELTTREQQVLGLVTLGLTNRQIGERLFISDKTASVHVSAILRKLGATSRTEAAVLAGRLGLELAAEESGDRMG
ncbi:LuxR family transcriptional regulator [Ornithinimicrobium humiphilum]|nr:helix-turn-helix transcriptional regulator [Ornithinimicrobium humiphilum]